MPADSPSKRLFFAVWPPAERIPTISRTSPPLFSVTGGRLIPPENFHVTLLFLGSVENSTQEQLCRAVDKINERAFTLSFTRRDVWKNGIASLRCDAAPEALLQLHLQLKAAAKETGIVVEERPYLPHITLIRRANVANWAGQNGALAHLETPINWEVNEFSLVSSESDASTSDTDNPGSIYRILRRWTLTTT
ncbi:MAG TPA: RNA 2',3'-cyclic phosphodiesterase [Pseudomonadales bacterium]|nr:RNA 2',3'-cyclic phosphodiesterase [Pseudomonadales bacterium]